MLSRVLVYVACVVFCAGLSSGVAAQDKAQLDEAARLDREVFLLTLNKKYAEAVTPGERALAIYEKELGAEAKEIALAALNLAEAYQGQNDYARALPLNRRALALAEKLKFPAASLELFVNKLADVYQAQGDAAQVLPLRERALELKIKAKGPDDFYVGTASYSLAQLYNKQGHYRKALPLLQRTLAIFEKSGTDEIIILGVLKDLAETQQIQGHYAEAAANHQRALTLGEKVFGADNPALAPLVNNLAISYEDTGDYGRALPLLQRALALTEKNYGPEHPQTAILLSNLGQAYQSQGDYGRAVPLLRRSLAIAEKTVGPDAPQIATVCNNLAFIYQAQADAAQAVPLFQRSLAIREKTDGPEHPRVAVALSNLAVIYQDQGRQADALPLLQRSLAIREKVLGAEHPDVAISLVGLALLYREQGAYPQAAPLLQRALTITEKSLGPKHPYAGDVLHSLARLYQAQGDIPPALRYLTRETDITEANITRLLDTGSEKQKQAALDAFTRYTNFTISLHLHDAPANRAAAELALTTIFRRKGRALDAFAGQIASLRQRATPEDQKLLDQLTAVRAEAAALALRGQSASPEARAAETEAERLEDLISRRSTEFRAATQPVTLARVRAALPADAALVEIVAYRLYNARAKNFTERFGVPRYAAYVLQRADAAPQFVDLGEAAPLDDYAQRLRAVLLNPKIPVAQAKRTARVLDEKVMRPVRKLLGPVRRVFLSPDGALNLVPFAALVDEQGHYLIENYSFNYLTSGRDLLRLPASGVSLGAPAIIANPLFDEAPAATGGADGRRSIGLVGTENAEKAGYAGLNFSKFYYSPLSGTATEAQAVNNLLPQAQVWTQADATEAALKAVTRPRILHIATHGFFLPDQAAALTSDNAETAPQRESPMLRSGLILAGVNQGQSGPGNDGVLTAQEAAGLDLYGTKLVVLSACETGLGDVQNGAGVYGLRRALFLAGSETQLMSLWQVSDKATRDLMIAYYQRLQAGGGRTEALRQVQLAMLRGAVAKWRHPYYWAAFIPSGAWTALDGKEEK